MTPFLNPYDPPQTPPVSDDPYRRLGCVSIWAGSFGSVDAVEWYFGVPAPDGRLPPPYSFIEEFQLPPFSPECLEINFTQSAPRRVRELLESTSFSSSYVDAACDGADRLGIEEAQGVALLFNFDYQACPKVLAKSPNLRFLGVFEYDQDAPVVRKDGDQLRTPAEIAATVGFSEWAVLALHAALQSLDEAGHNQITARQLCDAVQRCEGGATFLRGCGLATSEDLGRLVYGLVGIGFMRAHPGDQQSDFDGVYSL
jgi:hypothetical protein